jgi:hypothetical protein
MGEGGAARQRREGRACCRRRLRGGRLPRREPEEQVGGLEERPCCVGHVCLFVMLCSEVQETTRHPANVETRRVGIWSRRRVVDPGVEVVQWQWGGVWWWRGRLGTKSCRRGERESKRNRSHRTLFGGSNG